MVRPTSITALLTLALFVCGCSGSPSASHAAKAAQLADGSTIAFSRGAPDGGIYEMNPDGTRLRQLTNDPGDDQASWSPAGSKIAFNRYREGDQDIYVMRADRRGVRRLTNDGASSSPAWSPDGTRIAFAREARGNADIYEMNTDGTRMTRLTRDRLLEYSPAWSPGRVADCVRGLLEGSAAVPDAPLRNER